MNEELLIELKSLERLLTAMGPVVHRCNMMEPSIKELQALNKISLQYAEMRAVIHDLLGEA